MGFFDDNGFDDIIREFFGNSGSRSFRSSSGGRGKMPANQVITKKHIFLIFDFSGEENIDVEVKEGSRINEYGEEVYSKGKFLSLSNGSQVIGEYSLPDKLKSKDMNYTFNNGILEVSFKK